MEDVQAAVLDLRGLAAFLGRGECVAHEPGLVQRVGVQGDLDTGLLADPQRRVDHRGRGTPILVDLETESAAWRPGRAAPSLETVLPLASSPMLTG